MPQGFHFVRKGSIIPMKKNKISKSEYGGIIAFSRLFAPIFKALYYIFIGGLLLCAIIALIIFLVNTSVEDMLLPPLMSQHSNEFYSITIGNGIRIDAPYASVTLSDIKTVIYAELIMVAAVCCMMSPVSLFLSKLMTSISEGDPYRKKNGRYGIYIGLSVMVGYTFVLFARRFYNYLLVKTFVSDSDAIHLSLGIDLGGILVGLLIIFLGNLIGHAAEKRSGEMAVEIRNSDTPEKM